MKTDKTIEEPLVSFHRKSDFETNLFLKREVKELREKIDFLINGDPSIKDKEIAELKSEVAHLRAKIKRMNIQDMNNGKKKLKDIIKAQKLHIAQLMKQI